MFLFLQLESGITWHSVSYFTSVAMRRRSRPYSEATVGSTGYHELSGQIKINGLDGVVVSGKDSHIARSNFNHFDCAVVACYRQKMSCD